MFDKDGFLSDYSSADDQFDRLMHSGDNVFAPSLNSTTFVNNLPYFSIRMSRLFCIQVHEIVVLMEQTVLAKRILCGKNSI